LSLDNKATEAKYNISIPVTNNIGIMGNVNGQSCFVETKLRVEILGVGPTCEINVEGRTNSSKNWYVIATYTGPAVAVVDISTYDYIRYTVTVADGTGIINGSGYVLNSNQSTTIKNSSGIELGINPNGSLDVVDGLSSGGVYGLVSMPLANTAYEAKVGASALAGRKSILINILSANVYWGTDNSVTVATGMPLTIGQQISMTLDSSGSFKLFLVSSSAGASFKMVEVP
jgi:hypothetical protein